MQLTKKQEAGLAEAITRFKNHEKYITIAGYAGTGKTTLVKFIIDALDVAEDKVAYVSFTGKAAEILRRKGNKNAMTLHKLLYDSIPRPGGGFFRKPKLTLEYDIVVVDECSMVPKSMIDMLLRHKIFILFLGDPGQLPMIDKNESHDLLDHPHVFLDEIMRQAAESEIIQLTMKIRNGENIPYMKGNDVMIIPKQELVTGHFQWADQIICATNATRVNINNQMRGLLGFSGSLPQDGEKMICLRNYWEDISDSGELALVNGMTGIIHNPFETFRDAPRYVKMRDHRIPLIQGEFTTDDGEVFSHVDMDKYMIETGEPFLDWRESYTLGRLKPRIGDITPRSFTYGYAITCHKSQGSEWNKVLVLEESFPFDREEHKRWLYTAATRCSEKLVLMR
jgi:ATP-dependent exoDNAse (exonuclease V) alpha subunit